MTSFFFTLPHIETDVSGIAEVESFLSVALYPKIDGCNITCVQIEIRAGAVPIDICTTTTTSRWHLYYHIERG